MDYPYKDQAHAKANVSKDDFILFADGGNVLNSGTVVYKDGDHIKVQIEGNDGENEVVDFDLNDLTLYKGKDWGN